MKIIDDRYELGELLGVGAAGKVHRAFDKKLQRHVILKFLHSHQSKSTAKRFQTEALALSKLRHPNIVHLYEYVEKREQPYLVLEDIGGISLDEAMEAKPIDLYRAVQIILDCAQGLAAAHQEGIYHRDVKPGNVVLAPNGRAKLIDFGLLLDSKSDITRMTEDGCVVGTLAYMAPELMRGDEASARSDIYALGVTLFEMLTSNLPYEHVHIAAIILPKAKIEVPEVLWPDDLPEPLVETMTSLIALSADKRPRNMGQVVKKLKAVLAILRPKTKAGRSKRGSAATKPSGGTVREKAVTGPTIKGEQTGKSSTHKWRQRHTLLLTATVCVLLVAVFAFFLMPRKTPIKSSVLTPQKRMKLEQELSDIRKGLLRGKEKITAPKAKRVAQILKLLGVKKRLNIPSSTNPEVTTRLYLVRYGQAKKLPPKTVAKLMENLLQANSFSDKENLYIPWIAKHKMYGHCADFLLQKAKEGSAKALVPLSLELGKALLKQSDKRQKFDNSSKESAKFLSLYEFLLTELKGDDFISTFAYYVPLLSVSAGRDTGVRLIKSAQFLAVKGLRYWPSRLLLAEALLFCVNPTMEAIDTAHILIDGAILGVPKIKKNEIKLFKAYAEACRGTSLHTVNLAEKALVSFKIAIKWAKATPADTNRAKIYDMLIYHRARFFHEDESISLQGLEAKFATIEKSTLIEEDEFWYELAVYAIHLQNKRFEDALRMAHVFLRQAPHHFRPSMLGRVTVVGLWRGAYRVGGQ